MLVEQYFRDCSEFKDINPRTFKELARQFNLAPTTMNRNYNEAIKYHKLRKPKSPTRKDGKKTDQEGEVVEMSRTPSHENLLETGSDKDHSPKQDMDIVELKGEGEVPKVLLVLKQEPSKQELRPEGESQ